MNGNPQKAADEIIQLANKFKSLFSAAEELQKLGGLAQVEKELVDRKAKAESDCESVLKDLGSLQERSSKADAEIKLKNEQAKALIEAANGSVAKIESDARERAREILADAMEKKAEADGMLKDARKKVAVLDDELSEKKQELKNLSNQLDGVKSQVKKFLDV